jgi:HEAT repeat protein
MDELYNKDELFDLVNTENAAIDFNKLYPLAIDADSEVRQLTAELLAKDRTVRSESALIGLLKDSDELVRAEAADSLSYYSGSQVLDGLMASLRYDDSEIVRSYALLSYWDAYFDGNAAPQKDSLFRVLSDLAELEKNLQVKLEYAGLLYLCGKLDMLDYLLEELNNADHYIRNTVMNNLVRISNEENIDYIKSKLQPHYNKESVEFVKKKMEAFLSYTDDMLGMLNNKKNP